MKKVILILILLLSLLLRIVGVYPGYHPNHADEVNFQSQTVNILKTGSLEELRYEYPPLPAYINFISAKFIFIPLSWIRFYVENIQKVVDGIIPLHPDKLTYNKMFQDSILGEREINVLFWVRTTTALIGVGIVFLTFKIANELFDEKTALISAFFVGINYRQVINSHFGLPDIYNAFFLSFAFWMIVKLWKKPDFKNYVFAAIACGLSFSTKYQFFSFIPFALVHLYIVVEKKNLRERIKTLFSPSIFIVPIIIALIFLVSDPYFFVRFETAKAELTYAALKYRIGKNFLDFYPISYLFHYGIGQVTSILILLGSPVIILRYFKRSLLIFSILMPFLYIMIYATGGGFYTRNFITITPLILIIAGVFIESILNLKFKYGAYALILVLLVLAGYENLNKDYVVISNYTKQWNQFAIFDWVKNNIPKGSTIAAHSSVPLPDYYFNRVDYDTYPAFSMDEFKEETANYAISNFEWATNDFYWWMTQNTANSLKYWDKPVDLLVQNYKAMALLEMEDFAVKSFVKPGLAPEANFLVSKLPSYLVNNKKLIKEFDFRKGTDGWNRIGSNTSNKDDSLLLTKGGTGDSYDRWESPKIYLDTKGIEVDYRIKTSDDIDQRREGYVFILFFDNKDRQIGVRLSKRNAIFDKWVDEKLISIVPANTTYFKVGLQVYNPALANVYLTNVKVYEGNVINTNSEGIKHIDIEENVLFPISHGNL